MTEIVVIADDLTGAGEIAAIGFRHGWEVAITTDPDRSIPDASILVIDTDSRLDAPSQARAKIAQRLAALAARATSPKHWFKKVDSVLRGNINAECEALANGLDRDRVLLVAANPGMGRTIAEGRYRVHATPLHKTGFAQDPHHPATTDEVVPLLEDRSGGLPVRTAPTGHPLAPGCLTIGDALSEKDLERWAEQSSEAVIPAGGGEFFEAMLRTWDSRRSGATPPHNRPLAANERALVVLGSVAPESEHWRDRASRRGARLQPISADLLEGTQPAAFAALSDRLRSQATPGRPMVIWVPPIASPPPDLPLQARTALARLTAELARRQAYDHLVIAGGSTTAALFEALDIHALGMDREWAQGVVSLRACGAHDFRITLKPGSYPWPDALDRQLFHR